MVERDIHNYNFFRQRVILLAMGYMKFILR